MGLSLKHSLHVIAMFSVIGALEALVAYQQYSCDKRLECNSKLQWDSHLELIPVAIQIMVIAVCLPHILSSFLGLLVFNTFPGDVELKADELIGKRQPEEGDRNSANNFDTSIDLTGDSNDKSNTSQNHCITSNHLGGRSLGTQNSSLGSLKKSASHFPNELPHLCFRVVTRGLYPELIQKNLNRNYLTCIESGLRNFSIEIVTDTKIFLSNIDHRIKQLVVPGSYKSSTGAMFKARALQYALEPSISAVQKGDYIVHLDEETIITRNVINGILNFALKGQHAFGQGLITYSNQGVVNWITTLADNYRVADDMGKLRFQFRVFHRPLFGWKGSFVVSKCEAEKDVSFDHGPDGSIAEDCYFSMVAYKKGYTFDFIEGEMFEKSPFTVLDLIRQRKRWIQGIWLTVHSSKIPLASKCFLAVSHYAMLSLPITTVNAILIANLRILMPLWLNIIGTFCYAITLYMYFFGLFKSFDSRFRSRFMLIVYVLCQICVLPVNVVCENTAVIWGLFGRKHKFYIVQKNIKSEQNLDP